MTGIRHPRVSPRPRVCDAPFGTESLGWMSGGYRRPAMDTVMRMMRWAEMDEAARAALCARGLADIFDP